MATEPLKPPLTSSEMALLLSLPPPPPPSSPPPLPSFPLSSSDEDAKTMQLFYAHINCDQPEPLSLTSDMEQTSITTKSEQHHHHHHKDKKSVRKRKSSFLIRIIEVFFYIETSKNIANRSHSKMGSCTSRTTWYC